MQIVIDIKDKLYNHIQNDNEYYLEDGEDLYTIVKNGTPLPKGHGRLIDIGKIDEDKINKDNPIIGLTINGEYIEAVSLDYLNNLSTIIEADKAGDAE